MKLPSRVALTLVGLLILAGCDTAPEPAGTPTAGTARTTPPAPSSASASPAAFDKALHDELIAMLERDQADREGTPQTESDQARTARLKEIIRAHGWPTFALVGEDGGNAAWAIAQHSDLDPAFQQEALDLLRTAVTAGQASPGNLAYLHDRVATGRGEPQEYGTQIRCGPDGPVPATPIRDEADVERRAPRPACPRSRAT